MQHFQAFFDWLKEDVASTGKNRIDLGDDTRSKLFAEKILHYPVDQHCTSSFECFRLLFEQVNRASKKISNEVIEAVESELVGSEYLWRLLTKSANEEIAAKATAMIIDINYKRLSPRIIKVCVRLLAMGCCRKIWRRATLAS